MTKGLKRYYGANQLHFVTFSCYHRLPLLGADQSRDIVAEILGRIRERYEFALVGYVVMPEHVHLLMGEPKRGTPSTVLQVVKERASRRIPHTSPHFWQSRFYDFNVWSHKKEMEKLLYMHLNPVKRGWSHIQRSGRGVALGFTGTDRADLSRSIHGSQDKFTHP